MNERITLIARFAESNLRHYTMQIYENLCKVPFGKNVDNREVADTLPYHFTIFSWDIKREKEVLDFLGNICFTPFKVLAEKVEIVEGNEKVLN